MLDGSTGIDVGSAFSFHNSINDFTRLLGRMQRVKEQIGAQNIVVVMVPSGHYGKPLASYLINTGIPVVIVITTSKSKRSSMITNPPKTTGRSP
ncbi:hypothetical protein GFC01_03755 [Desulfofundulus thermobenzoicus]|uniref:Transposase n=2 Tax=Desulfofundulus thermobenzoicus TaxID=29376 RepID=A0A6N7IN57_9FIRM|nr:hypothetical protein [Desulfofundulus thermobenzoicus]